MSNFSSSGGPGDSSQNIDHGWDHRDVQGENKQTNERETQYRMRRSQIKSKAKSMRMALLEKIHGAMKKNPNKVKTEHSEWDRDDMDNDENMDAWLA